MHNFIILNCQVENSKKTCLPSQQDVVDGLIEMALNVMQVAGQAQQVVENLPFVGKRKRRSVLSDILIPK